MENNVIKGVLLVFIGATLGGTFALPSKYASKEPWELLWGPFFFFATLLLPMLLTIIWFDELSNTWKQATWIQLLPPILFGMLWGFGSFVSGLAFAIAGLSLAYAITMGMQTSFGSIVPMILGGGEGLPGNVLIIIIIGIIVLLAGVYLVGYAGVLKERKLFPDASKRNKKVVKGILFAVFGGMLASCLNYSFSFGIPILEIAKVEFAGNAPLATVSVWVLALAGGSISSFGYCLFLFFRNKRMTNIKSYPLKKLLGLALIMAIFHNGAVFFYGFGSDKLGKLGPTIGFAIFTSGMLLVGNLNGFFTKEWKDVGLKTKSLIISGIFVLVTGIIILSYSNSIS